MLYNGYNVSTYTSTIAKSLPILKTVVRTRNLVSQLTDQLNAQPIELNRDIRTRRKHLRHQKTF